jgi:hypothetical protein
MAKKPAAKPQITKVEVTEILEANKVSTQGLVLVGIRGYYLDSMGVKGKNDRGMYDDAACVWTPNGLVTYNFNTDASKYRKGKGKGSEKGMAMLATGVWDGYYPGMHNGSRPHLAFRQGKKVKVIRDGIDFNYEDIGMFGINIHRGGNTGTSSLGCQTVPPDQWPSFKAYIDAELKRYGQKSFTYVLIEETARRAGNLKVA